MATWCRNCGAALKPGRDQDARQEEVLRRRSDRVRLDEACWSPTQSAGGYLWTVTEGGDLYRISPYGGSPCKEHSFGDGAGFGSLVIRDRTGAGPTTEPLALAAAPDRVMAFGLMSKRERTFCKLDPGETILADCVDRYNFLAAAQNTSWSLASRDGEVHVLAIDLEGGDTTRHPLESGVEAGPVLFQDRLITWSNRSVSILSNDGRETVPMAEGFEAWTQPQLGASLLMSIGQAPAMVTGRSLYLPGSQDGNPAILMLQPMGNTWKQVSTPILKPATCSPDASGQPLLSQDGLLATCADGMVQNIHSDPQLVANRAAFASGGFRAFFCESGGQTRLRFHSGSQESDEDLGYPDGFECSGFWEIEGAFVTRLLTGQVGSRRTEFLTWHC